MVSSGTKGGWEIAKALGNSKYDPLLAPLTGVTNFFLFIFMLNYIYYTMMLLW